jgi:hypothetical protein
VTLDKVRKSGRMSVVLKGNRDETCMNTRKRTLELLLAQLLEQRSNLRMGEAGERVV